MRSAPHGDVAQLGEHLLCKEGVRGSSPLISTIRLTDAGLDDFERLCYSRRRFGPVQGSTGSGGSP